MITQDLLETEMDKNNKSVKKRNFRDECYKENLVERLRELRSVGKKDLYGLCSSKKINRETFEYGIGVIIDDETQDFKISEMKQKGYEVWTGKKQQYVVFEQTL